jgi:hypothetical protein
MEFKPNLAECIETLAKKEYKASLRGLLASTENSRELQEIVELLRAFLESADFSKLRTESEKWLYEGRKVKFILTLESWKPVARLVVG